MKHRGLSLAEARAVDPAELRMVQLIDRGVWSEEVETICRVGAAIVSTLARKKVKWEGFLPEQYLGSATLPDFGSMEEIIAKSRSLIPTLRQFIAQYDK